VFGVTALANPLPTRPAVWTFWPGAELNKAQRRAFGRSRGASPNKVHGLAESRGGLFSVEQDKGGSKLNASEEVSGELVEIFRPPRWIRKLRALHSGAIALGKFPN